MELAKTAGPVAPLQQRPDASLPDLVNSVNDLAIVLGSLDRHEEALARAEEAVRIYRQLAHQRPDVFVPDLARSLAVRGRVIAADPSQRSHRVIGGGDPPSYSLLFTVTTGPRVAYAGHL